MSQHQFQPLLAQVCHFRAGIGYPVVIVTR